MGERRMTGRNLASLLGTSPSKVSKWLAGTAEPCAAEVFATELALHLTIGTLSRELGYLPIGRSGDGQVEEAIASSEAIDQRGKQIALGLWHILTAEHAARTHVDSESLTQHGAASTAHQHGDDTGGIDQGVPCTPRLYSMADAARSLGVSTRTVQRLIEKGTLDHVRVGRRVLIPIEATLVQRR